MSFPNSLRAVGIGVLLVAAGPVWAEVAPTPIRVASKHLLVGFDPERGELVELIDLKSHQNHAGKAHERAGLWELEFASGPSRLSPADAKSFRCQRVAGDRQALQLEWKGFEASGAEGLRVRVLVRLDRAEPLSRWQISIDGAQDLALVQARFPRVLNMPKQENEFLATPVWMGQQAANPRQLLAGSQGSGRRYEWAYPGQLSLQCMTYYSANGPGLYVAADDTAAFRKAFACFGDAAGNASCELVHHPENRDQPTRRWTLPYQVLLGTFQGDWLTAAEQYRAWATNQIWAKQSRLARGTVPDWVRQTGLWVWNRGRSPDVLGPAMVLQQELGLPVNVFWHWWHGCAYDAGFPEYLPPREGAESFKSALATAHEQGVHALVYMNQRLWGTTTKSWTNEGAEQFSVKAADGKTQSKIYNTFTRQPCASMCLGTDFWRKKYAGLAEQAARELGVDGIYMDQACMSLACYDGSHGHPLGGGTYWMNGFRLLASDIRQRSRGTTDSGTRMAGHAPRLASGPPVALAGEGCGEPWLPQLDLMLSLQVSKERQAAPDGWEPIPFFPAVYHPYAVTYGNYSSLTTPPYDDLWPPEHAPAEPLKLLDRKFSRQFYLEQARAFVWGQQPTIANFLPAHLAERREEIEYVIRLAKLRSRTARFLLHGIFLRPPELHAPETTLDISRLSIYAGQRGGRTTFQKSSPLALAGAWRARDGATAVVLASIADEPLTLSFQLDAASYGLRPGTKIFRTDEHTRQEIGKTDGGMIPMVVTLPERGACLLEFSKK